jgi:hypothetical protein
VIYTHIAAALLAAGVAGFGAWKVQDWRYGSQEGERLELEAKERGIRAQRGDKAAAGHEADKATIQKQFVTVTETVEKIIEKPVYRDMCFDADGLRAIRDAIHGPGSSSEPAPAVPGPERAREREQGGNPPLER